MATRRSIVVMFALLDLRHDLMEDFITYSQIAVRTLPNKNNDPCGIEAKRSKITKAALHRIECALTDLDEILVKHPVYVPGSLARMLLKPSMTGAPPYSEEVATRWPKSVKTRELNFMISLLTVLTGPNKLRLASTTSRIDCAIVMQEVSLCIDSYKEEYGVDTALNFFQQCFSHLKTVKSDDFQNTSN